VNSIELDTGPLGRLALSRSGVDRATQRREDTGWLESVWADPRSRVVVIRDSQALVTDRDGQVELVFVSPADAPAGTKFLLGVDPDDVAYFGVAAAGEESVSPRGDDPPYPPRARPMAKGADYIGRADGRDDAQAAPRPMALRQVGTLLSDRDAGLFTHAIALANWHESHTHCPRCGAPTVPAPAGHLTKCSADGTTHFPRLDPAVIMLVIDPEDRLLLARNALWPQGRMSVVAGFVEPGESAEHAVAREVHEETSIVVDSVRYLGSQPWPMPRSLMLGYEAKAPGGQQIKVDAKEIGEARWFSRAELLAAIEAGELGIAPSSSIARRLIEYWYGAELPEGSAGWLARSR
jgi:NAD+ diphosphatase